MEMISSLKNLGLTEKEARVYVAALQTGKATAYRISVVSGLKKPTTYVVLEELVNQGAMVKFERDKKQEFEAVSPEELFAIMRTKLKSAETALPKLEAISRKPGKKMRAEYYSGRDALWEMYNRAINDNKEGKYIVFCGSDRQINVEAEKLRSEISKIKVDKNIKRDLILTGSKTDVAIEVHDKITQIINEKDMEALAIDNSELADAIKEIFKLAEKDKHYHKVKHKIPNRFV